ncbi:MAG: phage tail assembly chaperone, partial [Acidobacteriota bacterium]
GTYQTNSFIVEFKRLSVAEMKQLPQDGTDADIARRVVAGWNEVEDANGQPLPFSAEALDKLLDIVGVAPAIVRTYFECVSGAQEKN